MNDPRDIKFKTPLEVLQNIAAFAELKGRELRHRPVGSLILQASSEVRSKLKKLTSKETSEMLPWKWF